MNQTQSGVSSRLWNTLKVILYSYFCPETVNIKGIHSTGRYNLLWSSWLSPFTEADIFHIYFLQSLIYLDSCSSGALFAFAHYVSSECFSGVQVVCCGVQRAEIGSVIPRQGSFLFTKADSGGGLSCSRGRGARGVAFKENIKLSQFSPQAATAYQNDLSVSARWRQ